MPHIVLNATKLARPLPTGKPIRAGSIVRPTSAEERDELLFLVGEGKAKRHEGDWHSFRLLVDWLPGGQS